MGICAGMNGWGVWRERCPPTPAYTTIAFCEIPGFQYSLLLDGCNLAKFCMFMKWDYPTWEVCHCAELCWVDLSLGVWALGRGHHVTLRVGANSISVSPVLDPLVVNTAMIGGYCRSNTLNSLHIFPTFFSMAQHRWVWEVSLRLPLPLTPFLLFWIWAHQTLKSWELSWAEQGRHLSASWQLDTSCSKGVIFRLSNERSTLVLPPSCMQGLIACAMMQLLPHTILCLLTHCLWLLIKSYCTEGLTDVVETGVALVQ